MTAAPPRLQLPDVTLVCVDLGTPEASLMALQQCMRHADFGEVLLFTDPSRVPGAPRDIHLRGLQLPDAASHAEFMLQDLAPYVFTSHALIVRHDAFVRDPLQWHPDFLLYDYIGAPMAGRPAAMSVGHGAFSLRSRRLLVALRMAGIAAVDGDDLAICHHHRSHLEQVHDVRFAPAELAHRFSQGWPGQGNGSFGFQGLPHLPGVLSPEALSALVHTLPNQVLQTRDGHALCEVLMRTGQLEIATTLLGICGRNRGRELRLMWLRAQLAMARWHHRRQSGFHA